MSKFLHRQRGLVFAILLISLSVTTVLWSTNIMTSVSLLESTAAGTKPDDDIRANIPDSIRQQNAPIRYNKNSSKKRPWNQPDLTFTLKSSAADGSSSSSSSGSRTNRLERIKHPRSQNAIKRNVEDQKEDNQNEDDKVKKEGEDQNEEEEDDTTKDETQVRNKTKSTRVKEKARTKTKKRRTTRKKKRRDER